MRGLPGDYFSPDHPGFLVEVERFVDLTGVAWGPHEGVVDWIPGARAAHVYSVYSLAHEWAHVVQLTESDLSRFHRNGFHFRVPRNETFGCYDPSLWKKPWAPIREAEVDAIMIQALAQLRFSRTALVEYASEISRWLPGSCSTARELRRRRHYDEGARRWYARRVAKNLHDSSVCPPLERCVELYHSNLAYAKTAGESLAARRLV